LRLKSEGASIAFGVTFADPPNELADKLEDALITF
jgi:hypothetical protein